MLELDEINEHGRHIVLWSGGCDSTLTLYQVAKEAGTPDKPVHAVTVKSYFVDSDKEEKERRQRISLLRQFHEEGLHIKHTVISIEGNSNRASRLGAGDNWESPQSTIWYHAIASHLQSQDNVYVSYLNGESFIHKKESFQEYFKQYKLLVGLEDTQIHFPLLSLDKSTVIYNLKDFGLYEYTWYCEEPEVEDDNITQCNTCGSCTTHFSGLRDLYFLGELWAYQYLPPESQEMLKEPSELEEDGTSEDNSQPVVLKEVESKE